VSNDLLLGAAGTFRQSYEEVDWSATPVGPLSSWSPALRNAVDLALHTQFPVALFWGPEFVLIYNEAFVPLIADKHPTALGRRAYDVFPEAWETIGPMMQTVLAGEGSTWVEDESVPVERHGLSEEAYFTFSYSPVRGDDGTIEGVMNIGTETTPHVVDRRRLQMLSRLWEVLGDLEHAEDLPERALSVLRSNGEDLPAIAVRLDDEANYANGPQSRAPRSALGLARPSKRPVLSVNLSDTRPPDAAYFAFLRLIAASLAQATGRVNARDAERAIGEALQRSLLTKPAQTDDTQVAVRYLPAALLAQIGGDWYDAFNAKDGTLMLAVGDVNGHDQEAAVAMAQVRNLLRGVAYTTHGSPARVLTTLDTAMVGLEVGLYATAILARVEADDSGRTLHWSNAGHPPPVLIAPDGHASMLETMPEILLGLGEGERSDHAVALERGSTVVFYTDGLVERRRVPLQAGFDWLVDLLDGLHGLDAETICDHIVAHIDETVDDDIVLLVLRAV
jgi:hypothetical protein